MKVTPEQSYPLTQEHHDAINAALGNLDKADRIIERAERAGIPMAAPKQDSAMLRGQLKALKEEFFGVKLP